MRTYLRLSSIWIIYAARRGNSGTYDYLGQTVRLRREKKNPGSYRTVSLQFAPNLFTTPWLERSNVALSDSTIINYLFVHKLNCITMLKRLLLFELITLNDCYRTEEKIPLLTHLIHLLFRVYELRIV